MAAAAFVMLAAATLNGAAAYFTTYVSAGGSRIVHMGAETEIEEEVVQMVKHVSITNTSQTNACFVRVKVFHGAQISVVCTDGSESGDLWEYSEADGYWYYGPILEAGESSGILDVKIGDLPEDFDRDSFNVVVVQECTPVVYDEAGNPTADWTAVYSEYRESDGQREGAR